MLRAVDKFMIRQEAYFYGRHKFPRVNLEELGELAVVYAAEMPYRDIWERREIYKIAHKELAGNPVMVI